MLAVIVALLLGGLPPEDPLPKGAVARFGSLTFCNECETQCLSFSPDGALLAGGRLHVARAPAVSPDGRLAVRTGQDGLELVEVATRSVVAVMERESWGRVCFSPDARLIAVTDTWSSFRLYDTNTGEQVPWSAVTEGVASVAFSPDGRWMATGMRDTTVLLWRSPLSEEKPPRKVALERSAPDFRLRTESQAISRGVAEVGRFAAPVAFATSSSCARARCIMWTVQRERGLRRQERPAVEGERAWRASTSCWRP